MFNLDDPKQLAQDLGPLISTIRSRRQPVIEKMLKMHEAWKNKSTRSFVVSDTFNHQVAYFRRTIERFVTRGAQMVLPASDYFEVMPNDEEDSESGKKAESVQAYLQYLMRKKIRIYAIAKQLFRSYVLYQRAISKTSVLVTNEDGTRRVWPTMRVVDPYLWFSWPETAGLEQAQLVVEDAFIPWDQYQLEVANGRAAPIKKDELTDPTWPDDLVRRLAVEFFTPPSDSSNSTGQVQPSGSKEASKAVGDWVFRSEVWLRYEAGWRFVWLVWNIKDGPKIVRVGKKTYNRPQYRVSIAREMPSEQYTSSMGDDLVDLHSILKDETNLYLEGLAMQTAGPVAVDNNLVQRPDTIKYRPRALWRIPPDGVRRIDFPDTSKAALQGISVTTNTMDLFSGSSPLAEGQSIRNMPRAGFAVSNLMSMSLADIRDVARSLEEDILTPSVEDLYKLSIEFIPSSQIMRIPRTQDFPAMKLTKKDIEGSFDFNWVGSLQMQDYNQRAQRMLDFMNQLAPVYPQIAMELQQKGYQINWVLWFKRLWRYALGERGSDTIIEKLSGGQMNATAAMQLLGQLNMGRTSPPRGNMTETMPTMADIGDDEGDDF